MGKTPKPTHQTKPDKKREESKMQTEKLVLTDSGGPML